MRDAGARGRARWGSWLAGIGLTAITCTSGGPPAARESPAAPPSFGSTARATIAFHADPGGRDDTFTMDASGRHLVAVTDGEETVARPSWSPDGERLLIACCTSESGRLFLTDGPGAPLVAIAPDVPGAADPAWSPDGRRIAFGSVDDGMLYVVDVADGTPGPAQPLVAGAAPSWSPDGTHLTYLDEVRGNVDVYSVADDGTDIRRLTRDRAPEYSPLWSPDGEHIAFVSEVDGDQDIVVMDADGAHQIDISRDRWPDEAHAWSPDGRYVLFVAYRDGADPLTIGDGDAEIILASADGSTRRNLSGNAAWDGDPSWSPDGTLIVFTRRTDHADVYVMRSDGSDQRRLRGTRGDANDCCAVWRPSGTVTP